MKTFDTSHDTSILMIDRDGVIVDARENTRSALGWERGELVNKRMSELLEYGGDLLMERLHEVPDESNAEFSVLTLVRKQDQSCVPTTAQVRRLPELDCFTVAFDDIPGENVDAPQAAPIAESRIESAPEPETSAPSRGIETHSQNIHARDLQQRLANTPANPRFRNIFLNDKSQRNTPKPEPAKPESAKPEPTPMNVQEAPVAQIETTQETEQEQRRLEARVLSLTDQLQQLHAQLKTNLESETIAQKRLRERELQVQTAEERRTSAEAALVDEQKQRESLQAELAQLKSTSAQQAADRAVKLQEFLAKIQSAVAALHESDLRLATELEARRDLHQSLQTLQSEFAAQS